MAADCYALILQVDNHGYFWAWVLSEAEQFPAQLEQVDSEITKYFGSALRQPRVNAVARDQHYLVEKRPGQWARAVVRQKFQSSKGSLAEVLFIDHGTVNTLALPATLHRFLPMPSMLEDYPPLARQFRFSGIVPTKERRESSLPWGQTALKHIQRISHHSKVSLKVPNTGIEVPEVVVYTIDGLTNINSCLVEVGVAQWKREEREGEQGGAAMMGEGQGDGMKTSVQPSLVDGGGAREKMPVMSKLVEHDPVIMVSSPRPLPPISDFGQLGLPASLRQKMSGEFQPSPIHTHIWPHILEGDNVLAVYPPIVDAKLAFLLPLFAACIKQQRLSRLPGGRSGTSVPAANGPSVIVLCVNSQEVDNVTNTFSLLMSKVLAHERFKCVKSYGGIEEETPLLLLNGCDFFMVTPSSLLRLLKKKQMTLGRLDHLVFHGASDLVESFPEEIKLIMRHYVAAVSEMCRLGSLQIVAMTTQCTPDVLSLMEVYAKGGQTVYHTIFSCAIEAAVARKPKLEVVMVTDFASKLQWLRDYLLAGDRQSVVVTCVSCDQEMEELTRFIRSHSLPALILTNEQDLITFKAHFTASQHIVLHDRVFLEESSKVLSQLPLTGHLVHYSLPSTVSLFRERMALLLKAFRKPLPSEVVIFTAGSTPDQKKYIARLLHRMGHTVTAGLQTEEHQSSSMRPSLTNYDLCYYFCAFGECKVKSGRSCKLVHSLLPLPDQQHRGPPLYPLPSSGTVKFQVCHVGNGSRMWIRILEHHPAKRGDAPFIPQSSLEIISLCSELSQYFANHRQRLMKPKEGDYCMFADQDGGYHRAHIFGFDREVDEYFHHRERAKVRLFDSGPSIVVELNQLMELPSQFLLQPRQVAEAYVCYVRPNDRDRDFNPQAVAFVRNQFDGKELWGRVVHSHQGILWLDTVEERVHLEAVGVSMSVRNWRIDLLKKGLAEDNKEHLVMLHSGEVKEDSPQPVPGYAKLEKGQQYEVLLAAVNSTAEFYLQTKTSQQPLDELFEKLNEDKVSGSAFGKILVKEGQMVAAVFPEDKCWYRGRVVDYSSSSRQYQVLFVDYGELKWVRETAVQHISDTLLDLSCQAVRACLIGLELTPVLAKEAGARLEAIAEDSELTAKVVHVEDSEENFPYHYVQLFDARGRDVVEVLKEPVHESGPVDPQSMTETTPPLPTEALGPLVAALLSPSKSVADLKHIHASIETKGAGFPLAEDELEWVICNMSQQSTEVMSTLINILTALVYHEHPSVRRVLCEARPLKALRGLLKVVSSEECAKLVIILRYLLSGQSADGLLCKEWVGVLCHVLALLHDTSALQDVLYLLTWIVTERASLIPSLISNGGLSTVVSMLTVLPEPEVQPAALRLLLAVVTKEEGHEVALSAGPVKAVVSTLLQTEDKQALLLALSIAKELVSQHNRHTTHLLEDPLQRLLRSHALAFVKTVVPYLLNAIAQLRGRVKEEEARQVPKPKPIQEVRNQNRDHRPESNPTPYRPLPLRPNVLWSQTRLTLVLRVQSKDCSEVVVEFGTRTVKMSGLCEGVLHSLDLILYKEINGEASSYRVTSGEVVLRVVKKKRELWPRVMLDKTKYPFIQADFDHLSDSSSGEEQEETDSSYSREEGDAEKYPSVEETASTAVKSNEPPAQLLPDLHLWEESEHSSHSSSEEEHDMTLPEQWSDHDDNFI